MKALDHKIMKSKIQIIFFVFFFVFLPAVVRASTLPVRVYATDAIAGYSSAFRTSQIHSGDELLFIVEKPDGSVIRIPTKADVASIAQADFFGHHTKQAGLYRVAVAYPNSNNASPQVTFQVVSDRPSLSQSTLTSSKAMIKADNKDHTFITVTLLDPYRNPVKDHPVQLISSRSDDVIEVLNPRVTNAEGRVNFRVTSQYPGISVFSALDTTLNQVLSDRHEVVFFAPTERSDAIGGNSFTADLLSSDASPSSPEALSGPVDHFDIADLPSMVKVGEDKYFTVIARDKNNNVARNYTGTILISVPEDENAALPNNGEYTFKASDQGKFTFNLALRLSKLGKQVVQVFDKNDWKISGEFPVEVVPAQTVVSASDPASEGLKIKSPTDGAELGSNLVVLSGQGAPNINLKLFDNDVKMGDSETDVDGFFNYQAKNLQSGMHSFYVMAEGGETSSPVNVKIDTLPPVINQFEVKPDGVVEPGSKITVRLYSESKLESALVRFQGAEERLEEQVDQAGTYVATLTAPTLPGSFPIDVILIDSLANKAEFLNKATIMVVAAKKNPPVAVAGLTGEAGDRTVVLHWEALTQTESPLKHYRVHYGVAFTELTQQIDTTGVQNTLSVASLENDHQYFFAVSAVDSDGLEGAKSVVIAVTPKAPQVNLPVATAATLQGESLKGAVSLFWSPSGDPRLNAYRVYFGLSKGAYDDHMVISNTQSAALISDLIDGIPYYFAVAGVDTLGQEISSLSNEISLVPGNLTPHFAGEPLSNPYGSFSTMPYNPVASLPSDYRLDMHRIPQTAETGMESVWLILLSLFSAASLYVHKRSLLKSTSHV